MDTDINTNGQKKPKAQWFSTNLEDWKYFAGNLFGIPWGHKGEQDTYLGRRAILEDKRSYFMAQELAILDKRNEARKELRDAHSKNVQGLVGGALSNVFKGALAVGIAWVGIALGPAVLGGAVMYGAIAIAGAVAINGAMGIKNSFQDYGNASVKVQYKYRLAQQEIAQMRQDLEKQKVDRFNSLSKEIEKGSSITLANQYNQETGYGTAVLNPRNPLAKFLGEGVKTANGQVTYSLDAQLLLGSLTRMSNDPDKALIQQKLQELNNGSGTLSLPSNSGEKLALSIEDLSKGSTETAIENAAKAYLQDKFASNDDATLSEADKSRMIGEMAEGTVKIATGNDSLDKLINKALKEQALNLAGVKTTLPVEAALAEVAAFRNDRVQELLTAATEKFYDIIANVMKGSEKVERKDFLALQEFQKEVEKNAKDLLNEGLTEKEVTAFVEGIANPEAVQQTEQPQKQTPVDRIMAAAWEKAVATRH